MPPHATFHEQRMSVLPSRAFDRSSISEAEDALQFLQAKDVEQRRMSSLSRMSAVQEFQTYLTRLKLDLRPLKIVHIAGSKGKGSTAAFTESILHQFGLRTGMLGLS